MMRPLKFVLSLAFGALPAVLFLVCFAVGIRPDSSVPVIPAADKEIAAFQPHFDGAAAYGALSELVTRHPNRFSQTKASEEAASWARARFAAIGAEARIEEFHGPVFFRNSEEIGPGMALKSLGKFTAPYPGWNVVATLPGEYRDLILVGAHLDMSDQTVEGAKDDGSGVVITLELARALSGASRRFSFLFVLFDGEELALRGSLAFAAMHPELPIRHVLIIDTVGQTVDDTIYSSHIVSYRGAGNSAALGLVASAAAAEGFGFSVAFTGYEMAPLPLKLLLDRSIGIAGMDTGSFLGRARTVVGMATGGNERSFIHTPEDTIGKIDADTLARTGRAAERYLAALDAGLLPALGGTLYVPAALTQGGVGISPDRDAWLLFGAAGLAVILAAAVALIRARSGLTGFPAFIASELAFICALIGVPFTLSCGLALLPFLPIAVYFALCVLWFPAAFIALPLLRRRRVRSLDPLLPARQKLLLSALTLIAALAWMVLRGPFAAIIAALPAVMVNLPFCFATMAGRIGSRIATAAAGLYSLVIGIVLAGIGFLEGGLLPLALLLGLALLTATVGIYGFSFPRSRIGSIFIP
jgi:hypothetical protein